MDLLLVHIPPWFNNTTINYNYNNSKLWAIITGRCRPNLNTISNNNNSVTQQPPRDRTRGTSGLNNCWLVSWFFVCLVEFIAGVQFKVPPLNGQKKRFDDDIPDLLTWQGVRERESYITQSKYLRAMNYSWSHQRGLRALLLPLGSFIREEHIRRQKSNCVASSSSDPHAILVILRVHV